MTCSRFARITVALIHAHAHHGTPVTAAQIQRHYSTTTTIATVRTLLHYACRNGLAEHPRRGHWLPSPEALAAQAALEAITAEMSSQPWRNVTHAHRAGSYWHLQLECGHPAIRKIRYPRRRAAGSWHRPASEILPHPPRVLCRSCSGREPPTPPPTPPPIPPNSTTVIRLLGEAGHTHSTGGGEGFHTRGSRGSGIVRIRHITPPGLPRDAARERQHQQLTAYAADLRDYGWDVAGPPAGGEQSLTIMAREETP